MIRSLILTLMLVLQGHLNDCGVASVMMVANYYRLETPYETPEEWHYAITDGKDRALHITEIVWMLRDLGLEVEYTYSFEDVKDALAFGKYPMIFLDRRHAHYVVLWKGTVLDPKTGVRKLDWRHFQDEFDLSPKTGVGLLITNQDTLPRDLTSITQWMYCLHRYYKNVERESTLLE